MTSHHSGGGGGKTESEEGGGAAYVYFFQRERVITLGLKSRVTVRRNGLHHVIEEGKEVVQNMLLASCRSENKLWEGGKRTISF